MLEEGLQFAGLREEEMEGLPGSDPRKVALTALIWSKTTVGMKWIGHRLKMRSAANARQQIWISKNDLKWKMQRKTLPENFKQWLKEQHLPD